MTDHALGTDHNGDPRCKCGWAPEPEAPGVRGQLGAAAAISRHAGNVGPTAAVPQVTQAAVIVQYSDGTHAIIHSEDPEARVSTETAPPEWIEPGPLVRLPPSRHSITVGNLRRFTVNTRPGPDEAGRIMADILRLFPEEFRNVSGG